MNDLEKLIERLEAVGTWIADQAQHDLPSAVMLKDAAKHLKEYQRLRAVIREWYNAETGQDTRCEVDAIAVLTRKLKQADERARKPVQP